MCIDFPRKKVSHFGGHFLIGNRYIAGSNECATPVHITTYDNSTIWRDFQTGGAISRMWGHEIYVELTESGEEVGQSDGEIECRERLGGVLRYYHRSAA